jgi:arginyl-tRNA--protein-N-Asp/Glu arginylyltransferase
MKHNIKKRPIPFFITAPIPCPYLDGRTERRMVTDLATADAIPLHDKLSRVGFRRSHNLVYTPVCHECSACLAVRNVVDEFEPSNSQRRILRLNQSLVVNETPAKATNERFELFSKYQDTRHAGGDMATMDYYDFQALIEETPVITSHVDFYNEDGTLIAGCLVDIMEDGLSAVYSYFDPTYKKNSLGSYIILWLIQRTKQLSLPYLYLGYWVKGSQKMAYKDKFQPLEYYNAVGWGELKKAT